MSERERERLRETLREMLVAHIYSAREQKRRIKLEKNHAHRHFVRNEFWFVPHDLAPLLSSLLLLFTVSHFTFVFPSGYAKCPLFPHF